MPAFSRAFVDKTDASVTGTFLLKCRFVSGGEREYTHAVPPVATFAAVGCRSRKQTYPASPNYATQPPLVVSRVPSAERRKQRHAKRETRAVGRSASTSHRLAFTTCAYGWASGSFRYIPLRSTAATPKSSVASVDLHSISPAPYAQPPLA